MADRAVVVGVGDELLSGLVVNTNAAMIGELLLGAGIRVARSVCVGDDEGEIVEVLRGALQSADAVIVTGGLGPTQDDRTREAIARLLGTRLRRDDGLLEGIRDRFIRLGRPMPEANAQQADIPEGADAIPNPWGTAPGIRAVSGDACVYAIPGVPREARHMLTEQIIPELLREGGGSIRTREVRCCGLPESELAERLAELATAENPRLAYLPGGGEVRIRFVATGEGGEECERLLDRAETQVRSACGDAVYGAGGETLEAVTGRLLADGGYTVATAESCTAGMLAARIGSVPGASRYLLGGVVAYQDEVKVRTLGVDAGLLSSAGAVSDEVAVAMATGARERFACDFALSVTCVAGPDPQDGVEVGTACIGLAGPGGEESARRLRFPGDREQIRLFATTFGLNMLRLRLTGREPTGGGTR